MSSPADRVKVLQLESESLKDYLSGLSPDAWDRPSACARWTVADVVAHIASAFEGYTGNVTRGLNGDHSPTPGRYDASTWSTASSGERTRRAEEAAQRIVAYREGLEDRLLPTLHSAMEKFDRLLVGLTPQQWDSRCYHGRGVIPIPNQVTYAILEVCLHRWDIESRLESDAHLPEPGLGYLIDQIEEFMHWAFVSGPDFAEPKRYRFQLSGAVSGEKDVVIDEEQARLASPNSPPVDAVIQCDAETFLLLMCGRLKFADALADGRLVSARNDLTGSLGSWTQAI